MDTINNWPVGYKHKIVIITPRGTSKMSQEKVSRGLMARILFSDWRSKNKGEYFDVIHIRYSQEEQDKFPKVIDLKSKICDLISSECELYVDGIVQDVRFLMDKYWNQLNHK